VLKQQKLREITRLLGETAGLDCLDLGSDNGVVSLLLRRRGGRWHSADLDPVAVASTHELVGTNVHQLDGARLPFPDDAFDAVVVVDLLEHVREDAALVADLHRITRPGGRLIVNVPHAKDSLLRRVRLWLGQTDERHGHVRHGYTAESLARVLGEHYRLVQCHTYSRVFCEALDTLITAAYGVLKGTQAEASSKGVLVTGRDLARFRTLFRLYSALYPAFWLAAQLDRLLGFTAGYMLIAEARSTKAAPTRASLASAGIARPPVL
jgi:SAM-dependent methyltransferase